MLNGNIFLVIFRHADAFRFDHQQMVSNRQAVDAMVSHGYKRPCLDPRADIAQPLRIDTRSSEVTEPKRVRVEAARPNELEVKRVKSLNYQLI